MIPKYNLTKLHDDDAFAGYAFCTIIIKWIAGYRTDKRYLIRIFHDKSEVMEILKDLADVREEILDNNSYPGKLTYIATDDISVIHLLKLLIPNEGNEENLEIRDIHNYIEV